MRTAYNHNCRRLWIANVHDPKVAAYHLELFLDMAWNINSVKPTTLCKHLENWLCRQFGEVVGKRLFPAVYEYYRLCGIRKPEFMGWTQVELDKRIVPGGKSLVNEIGMTHYEAAKRLEDFASIKRIVDQCQPLVRPELQEAYFASIIYPIYSAAAMTRKVVSDSIESHRAYEEIQQLTARYNALCGGKWQGIMDAAPRQLPVFNDVCGRLIDSPSSVNDYQLSCNASDYDTASAGCQSVQMLGHSMNALSIPKGGEVTYNFTVSREGDAMIYTAMIPTQPNDRGDLRYQITLDDQSPVIISLKEKYRSEFWKQSVLRGQALKNTPVKITKGFHSLTVKALDDHIILDQWMIDFNLNRKFYVIPVAH